LAIRASSEAAAYAEDAAVEDEEAPAVAKLVAASAFSAPKDSTQRVKSAAATAAEEAMEATMDEMDPPSGCVGGEGGGGDSPELVGALAMVVVVDPMDRDHQTYEEITEDVVFLELRLLASYTYLEHNMRKRKHSLKSVDLIRCRGMQHVLFFLLSKV
jgi:hypothetical protein